MPTVYITAPPTEAEELARALVERRLAACVNRVDCHSTYRWEGDVVADEEVILLAKTTDAMYPALVEYVHEHHPYEVPCIERFDEADIDAAFGAWITETTGQTDADGTTATGTDDNASDGDGQH
jgi:periplasmic divalent cation tolerance protein